MGPPLAAGFASKARDSQMPGAALEIYTLKLASGCQRLSARERGSCLSNSRKYHALRHDRSAMRENKEKARKYYGSKQTDTKVTTGCPGSADQSTALRSCGNRRGAPAVGT